MYLFLFLYTIQPLPAAALAATCVFSAVLGETKKQKCRTFIGMNHRCTRVFLCTRIAICPRVERHTSKYLLRQSQNVNYLRVFIFKRYCTLYNFAPSQVKSIGDYFEYFSG